MLVPGPAAEKVAAATQDVCEYLVNRQRDGSLDREFTGPGPGKVAYQMPCHLRAQNMGYKTRDVLQLVPGTTVQAIERCSGHDGTYGVKKEYAAVSRKIARPVARQVDDAEAQHFTSDCPMAAEQIAIVAESAEPTHPIQLLRKAYGI
jgi:Fe-S oxidoreductase